MNFRELKIPEKAIFYMCRFLFEGTLFACLFFCGGSGAGLLFGEACPLLLCFEGDRGGGFPPLTRALQGL